MLNKLGQWFAWLIAAIIGLWWLRKDAKQDAKAAAEAEQKNEVINRVSKAKKVDQSIDQLNSSAKRERLRQSKRK